MMEPELTLPLQMLLPHHYHPLPWHRRPLTRTSSHICRRDITIKSLVTPLPLKHPKADMALILIPEPRSTVYHQCDLEVSKCFSALDVNREQSARFLTRFSMLLNSLTISIWTWSTGEVPISLESAWGPVFTCGTRRPARLTNFAHLKMILSRASPGYKKAHTLLLAQVKVWSRFGMLRSRAGYVQWLDIRRE